MVQAHASQMAIPYQPAIQKIARKNRNSEVQLFLLRRGYFLTLPLVGVNFFILCPPSDVSPLRGVYPLYKQSLTNP